MLRRALSAVLLALPLASAACLLVRAPVTPMTTRPVVAGVEGRPGRCVVFFLPGKRDSLGAYRSHHWGEMGERAGLAADFVEVDAHMGYYRAQTISRRLHEDVVAPALARGIEKVWIVGISMGGLGGILYAREHPEGARGVVAFAPFLGDEEPRLVASAGGLAKYEMGPARPVADYERELWGWLKRFVAAGADRPHLFLGLGTEDELAPANRLLGDALPADRVFTEKGGHDWGTWTKLWQHVLDRGAIQRDCAP